jgi:hypothetical protein
MNPTEQIKIHILCVIKDRKWSWHWHGILRHCKPVLRVVCDSCRFWKANSLGVVRVGIQVPRPRLTQRWLAYTGLPDQEALGWLRTHTVRSEN